MTDTHKWIFAHYIAGSSMFPNQYIIVFCEKHGEVKKIAVGKWND